MALNDVGRAESLTATGVSPTSNISVSKVQNGSYKKGKEVIEFKAGNRNVKRRYAGDKTGFIQIESTDFATYIALEEGQKYTNVVLTLESSADTQDAATGQDMTVTMSHAVLVTLSEPSHSNANRQPTTWTARFELDDHDGSGTEPTMTYAAVTP